MISLIDISKKKKSQSVETVAHSPREGTNGWLALFKTEMWVSRRLTSNRLPFFLILFCYSHSSLVSRQPEWSTSLTTTTSARDLFSVLLWGNRSTWDTATVSRYTKEPRPVYVSLVSHQEWNRRKKYLGRLTEFFFLFYDPRGKVYMIE